MRMGTDDARNKAAKVREERQRAKVVLKQLREHYEQLDNDKDEVLDCRSSALAEHFAKAEDNLGKARTVDQVYVDAQIFHKLGQYSRRQAAQLQTGLKDYDVKSFVDSLVMVMQKTSANRNNDVAALDSDSDSGPVAMSFSEIGESVWNRWKTVPGIDFMYGNAPTDDPRPMMQRKKAKRAKKGTLTTKPNELREGDVEQTETDRQVAEMKTHLKRRGKINYWKFVVDPDDETGYTRSIENIFHSSFLIKDMYAKLDLRSEPPMFEFTDPNSKRARTSSSQAFAQNSQFIMGFDRQKWKKVISEYSIKRCVLPANRNVDQITHDENLDRLRQMEARFQEQFE